MVYLGVDVGTSGRARHRDRRGRQRGRAILGAAATTPGHRRRAAAGGGDLVGRHSQGIADIATAVPGNRIDALAVDGTGHAAGHRRRGRPPRSAGMYNDASAASLAPRITEAALPESGAHGATFPLAQRLLALQERQPGACHALHQQDDRSRHD